MLLWLAGEPAAISPAAAKLLRGAQTACFVSAISALEVGQKAAARKVFLPKPVDEWFAAMAQRHQLQELPVTSLIAARATLLPAIHRDPFDRVLIATAQQHHLTLLTPDSTIAKYPNLGIAW